MKYISAIFAVCITLLGSGLTHAGNLIDMQVVSRVTGRTLPVYVHYGKSYVIGTPGERYGIRLANRTSARVMGVLSVDGVNAITGDTAAPNQVGYVLDPYQVAEIAGWRKSNDEVARFYFTSLPDSYAARTDRPGNVGVIGLAVFQEYAEPVAIARPAPFAGKAKREPAAAATPSMQEDGTAGSLASRAQEKLGTGHGEREFSAVTHTEFRRATSSPAEVVAIWYDSRERLASRGVLPHHPQYCADPQPFPTHYVADPGSW